MKKLNLTQGFKRQTVNVDSNHIRNSPVTLDITATAAPQYVHITFHNIFVCFVLRSGGKQTRHNGLYHGSGGL
jgi:hypothetical protein